MAKPAPSPAASNAIPAPPDDLCLDFANTLCWRGSARPSEALRHIDDLLDWCGEKGGMPAAPLQALRKHGLAAAELFAAAIGLRETIFRIFEATACGGTPARADLEALNHALAETPERRAISRGKSGYHWRLPAVAAGAAALLAPVLWSAGDLLVGKRLARVRQCANERCRWLFLDESKGGTRRWCSMSACGNRAKAHRHYLSRKRG